jgi:hypothetical protein
MHCAAAVNVALVPLGSRMNRIRACDAVRRAAGPHRRVQPFLSGCGLGSRWISPSIHQIFVRSRSDSPLRGELPAARCGRRITFVSSKWTTRKVDQVSDTEAFANLPQPGPGGRKETAQQSIPAEPLHPLMPALGVAIQPLEDPGQLGRDRGLSLAKELTGIVDQLHSLPKNRRQPPRRHPLAPQAGSRATLCGCCLLPRASTPCERSASRRGTNGSGTYQPVEFERSPSKLSWAHTSSVRNPSRSVNLVLFAYP